MKTLFLLDGVYQDAKKALCEILEHDAAEYQEWCLIKKYSTKSVLSGDMKPFPSGLKADELWENYIDSHKSDNERKSLEWFCYKYPLLGSDYTYIDVINGINTKELDGICDISADYGFLVVRNRKCINDLISRYEKNGRLNIVPVFVYTDYSYIENTDEVTQKKWKKLLKNYIENASGGRLNYEQVLIFKGDNYEDAKETLYAQIKNLIRHVETKNNDLFVVTENERTFLPEDIRKWKADLEKLSSPDSYKKNVFVMMKFEGDNPEHDKRYVAIKNAIEKDEYHISVRADDAETVASFPSAKPDQRYWLATYLCKYGVALFEADKKTKKVILNPNVIYEMGIMKQQGKEVCILVPNDTDIENAKLFFDVSNQWFYWYKNFNDIETQIREFLSHF